MKGDPEPAAILKLGSNNLQLPSNFMTDPRLLDEIGAKLAEVMARSPVRDVEKNVRAVMASLVDRFELVTREDFDVQKRVLERAYAQIAELEARVSELEARDVDTGPSA